MLRKRNMGAPKLYHIILGGVKDFLYPTWLWGCKVGVRLVAIMRDMDKQYLLDVANFHVRVWWKRFVDVYPQLGAIPAVKLNGRLKTTAGRAFLDDWYIDLSPELMWEHTEQFTRDTIPHELAHLVAYRLHGDPGHGKGWKGIVVQFNIPTTRCHNMVNSKWQYRR